MQVEYKISYGKRWNKESGTCYRQYINVKMSKGTLGYFNMLVKQGKKYGSLIFQMYAQELQEGINYCTLTTARYFAYMTDIKDDKRYKGVGVNTIINVTIK